jgi:putative holliday junction resolvase
VQGTLLRATRYTYTVSQSYSSSQEITPSENRRTRILGIDYGRARIGLAIADAIAALARPLETLERINRNEDMRRLREVVRNHGVKQIVVGLPLRLDGTRGEMAEEASRFAERVRKQLGVPVEMVDERLTSWEAERLLEEQAGRVLQITPRGAGENARKRAHPNSADSGQRKRKQAQAQPRSSVDAIAAAVILKEYLERQVAKEGA